MYNAQIHAGNLKQLHSFLPAVSLLPILALRTVWSAQNITQTHVGAHSHLQAVNLNVIKKCTISIYEQISKCSSYYRIISHSVSPQMFSHQFLNNNSNISGVNFTGWVLVVSASPFRTFYWPIVCINTIPLS